EALPAAPALDSGCGSGLLAQAWAALGRGPVLALDLDPRALAQAARSLAAAGLAGRVTLRRGPAEALPPGALAGRVLLANLPAGAQGAVAGRADASPAAAILSGVRPAEVEPLAATWAARGLAPTRRRARGGFVCLTLAGP